MELTFRWYGPNEPITLENIRQIPVMTGIVSALYDVPVGELWDFERLTHLKRQIEAAGLRFSVVEDIPVHENIKLGSEDRDELIDIFCQNIRAIGQLDIPILCYNFMPVFSWTRTNLALPLTDGSQTLSYEDRELADIDLSDGLPGWPHTGPARFAQIQSFRRMTEQDLWDNFTYFLKRVVPVAEQANVRLAIHPDDPPWPISGLPRIITSEGALQRVLEIVDSPANGLTLCSGSLGADPANDVPGMIRRFGSRERIFFAHCRNVKITGDKAFYESAHPTNSGSLDMADVMRAYREIGFEGPMRPDHGRMIWGEKGQPGYGLYDRALGAMYLGGLWDGVNPTG